MRKHKSHQDVPEDNFISNVDQGHDETRNARSESKESEGNGESEDVKPDPEELDALIRRNQPSKPNLTGAPLPNFQELITSTSSHVSAANSTTSDAPMHVLNMAVPLDGSGSNAAQCSQDQQQQLQYEQPAQQLFILADSIQDPQVQQYQLGQHSHLFPVPDNQAHYVVQEQQQHVLLAPQEQFYVQSHQDLPHVQPHLQVHSPVVYQVPYQTSQQPQQQGEREQESVSST